MADTTNSPIKPEDKGPTVAKEEKEQKKKYVERTDRNKEPRAEGEAKPEDKKEPAEKERRPRRDRPEGEGKEFREKPRRERKELQEYDFDPAKITEDTKLPKLPKKNEQKQKPDEKVYKQREEDINKKIDVAKEKRAKILAEKFERDKKVVAKEGEATIFDQFESEKEEVIKIREDFYACLDKINEKKARIEDVKNELKAIDDEIKSIDKGKKGDTKENIFDRMRRLEHQLLTDSLSPKEERDLHVEIQTLKRLIGSAESSENLEVELARLRERREEKQQEVEKLYAEKKVHNDEFNPLKDKLDKQNALVNKLKEECLQRKGEQKQFRDDVDKERTAFYDKKTERKEAIDAEINKLRDSKNTLWDEYHDKMDEFREQQNWIRWVEWQQRQKDRLVQKKEWEERKKKREEREKEDHARDEHKVRLYDAEIKNCEFLIDYCLRLIPGREKEDDKPAQPEMSKADIEAKLLEDKAWGKEKGLTVMETKKSRDIDDEPVSKKKKKEKKPQEKTAEKKNNFEHGLPILTAFDFVKVLLPQTQEDVEKTVNELREKLGYFTKLSSEEKTVKVQQKKEEPLKEEVAPIS